MQGRLPCDACLLVWFLAVKRKVMYARTILHVYYPRTAY